MDEAAAIDPLDHLWVDTSPLSVAYHAGLALKHVAREGIHERSGRHTVQQLRMWLSILERLDREKVRPEDHYQIEYYLEEIKGILGD